MEGYTFNINDVIYVKLNDEGYEHLAKYHNQWVGKVPNYETRDSQFFKDKANSNGFSQFQMWDFIQIFSSTIYMGCEPMFDLTIVISDKNLGRISL